MWQSSSFTVKCKNTHCPGVLCSQGMGTCSRGLPTRTSGPHWIQSVVVSAAASVEKEQRLPVSREIRGSCKPRSGSVALAGQGVEPVANRGKIISSPCNICAAPRCSASSLRSGLTQWCSDYLSITAMCLSVDRTWFLLLADMIQGYTGEENITII